MSTNERRTISPTMRWFLLALGVASAFVAGVRLVESFEHEELHKKDFVQEYALAKAVANRGEPYRPMKEMAKTWVGPDIEVNWPHPTPHTPVTAVLSVPFGWLDYQVAAGLWLALEVVLLLLTWHLLFRWWGGGGGDDHGFGDHLPPHHARRGDDASWTTRLTLVLLSLSLGPVIQELWLGNLSIVLLAMLVAAWLALRSGRDVAGGAWLGLAIAVKLTAWPIVPFLLLKGRWRAVVAAAVVLLGLHGVAVVVLGYEHVADYYLRVGPGIARDYRHHDSNYSLWTISSRLFGDPDGTVWNNFVAKAAWPTPSLDAPLKSVLPVAGLLVGLVLALRCRDFDSSIAVLLCVSLVVNPVAWDHSLLIATIPIAVVLRRLSWANFPRRETTLAVVLFAMTMFPQRTYLKAVAFATGEVTPQGTMVPFWAGLVTYVPLVALMGWTWLTWRTDDRNAV